MTKSDATIDLLAAQLRQRAKVILAISGSWSPSQALALLHQSGPSGQSLMLHLVEVTRSTLAALDLESPLSGSGETWAQVRAQFEAAAEQLAQGILSMPQASWQAEPAIEILPEFKHSLTTRHAFLLGHIFHLAYHAGQLGSLAAILADRKQQP